jgi:hypothetical protein
MLDFTVVETTIGTEMNAIDVRLLLFAFCHRKRKKDGFAGFFVGGKLAVCPPLLVG